MKSASSIHRGLCRRFSKKAAEKDLFPEYKSREKTFVAGSGGKPFKFEQPSDLPVPADSTVDRQKLDKLEQDEKNFLMPKSTFGKLLLKYSNITAKTYAALVPPFDNLNLADVAAHTNIHYNQTFMSQFLWTPLIQKIDPSEELLEYLEDIKYDTKKTVEKNLGSSELIKYFNKQTKDTVRAFIEDVIPGTGFDYYEDYHCSPSRKCRPHGNIDFMLYDKQNEHINYGFPLCIIQTHKAHFNREGSTVMYSTDESPVAGIAHWTLLRLNHLMHYDKEFGKRVKEDERLANIRIIYTNSHEWKLFEFDYEYRSRSTHTYRPREIKEILLETKGQIFERFDNYEEQRIWNDFLQMQIALGLIRFGLNTPDDRESALHETYQYLSDLQFHDPLTGDDKKEIKRREKRAENMPDWMARIYVGRFKQKEEKSEQDGSMRRFRERIADGSKEEEKQEEDGEKEDDDKKDKK